jgi:hypothetical protein
VLVGAAICPHPPLLVPQAMGAAGARPFPARHPVDAQLGELRAACRAAVADLAGLRPDLIIVVGGGEKTEAFGAAAAGSLRSFGIPFATGHGPAVLPLSLTVGAWLLRGVAADQQAEPAELDQARPWRLRLQAVAASLPPGECVRIGARLARLSRRVALLVMGDGPGRPATGVPGAPDPQASDYTAAVAGALARAAPGELARIDPALDARLLVAGRAAWQVLAGAAATAGLTGSLRYAAAPLGVSYLVAVWQPSAASTRRSSSATASR